MRHTDVLWSELLQQRAPSLYEQLPILRKEIFILFMHICCSSAAAHGHQVLRMLRFLCLNTLGRFRRSGVFVLDDRLPLQLASVNHL